MWRLGYKSPSSESIYFAEAMRRVEDEEQLRKRAEAMLRATAAQEPLLHDAWRTPQSPHFHAEGPTLFFHVRLMLTCLYAIVEGKMSLLQIEEFRRMKGYEGEIAELEETIKEQAGLLELFCLAHDAGKWPTLFFSAPLGSRGEKLGFNMDRRWKWDDFGASERAKMRERYLKLYEDFAAGHYGQAPQWLQAKFFVQYGIRTHYPGHDRIVHTPVYRQLLTRLATAHELSDRDLTVLEDLIAYHHSGEQFVAAPRSEAIRPLIRFCEERGHDADDFLDLLQAAVFLDMACSSKRLETKGVAHDFQILINFLRAEHDFAPERRIEKEARREEEEKKRRNIWFREAKLDGIALMDLLNMEPGPEFGKVLRSVQEGVTGEAPMPVFKNNKINQELQARLGRYYTMAFDKGGDGD
jgi:hypothetical protein